MFAIANAARLFQNPLMKTVRVPRIRGRADEVEATPIEMEWRGRFFELLAYSEKEARDWWRSLSDREREAALGLAAAASEESPGLF